MIFSDSKKIRWFQCLMCVNVNYVNNAPFFDDLVLDDYVNTAIYNVCVLQRLPRESRVSWAESLLDKMIDIFYTMGSFTFWLVFLTPFLFFSNNLKGFAWSLMDSINPFINYQRQLD